MQFMNRLKQILGNNDFKKLQQEIDAELNSHKEDIYEGGDVYEIVLDVLKRHKIDEEYVIDAIE